MKTPPEMHGWLVVAITLIGLAAGPVAHAEETQPTLIDEIKENLLGIQNNISNARVRLHKPLRGIASGSADEKVPDRPPTVAEQCCSANLKNMRRHAESMNQTLEQLFLYYSDRNQAAALIELDQIREQLNVVARGVAVFRISGSNAQAEQALLGLIRPFNELRAGVARLETCCPVEPATAADGETP
jgi:hypothetical protein